VGYKWVSIRERKGSNMAGKVETKILLDPDVDLELSKWSDQNERSKRRQIAVLLRRLTQIRKDKPEELQRLQLAQ
jgi:hypothetical protein